MNLLDFIFTTSSYLIVFKEVTDVVCQQINDLDLIQVIDLVEHFLFLICSLKFRFDLNVNLLTSVDQTFISSIADNTLKVLARDEFGGEVDFKTTLIRGVKFGSSRSSLLVLIEKIGARNQLFVVPCAALSPQSVTPSCGRRWLARRICVPSVTCGSRPLPGCSGTTRRAPRPTSQHASKEASKDGGRSKD